MKDLTVRLDALDPDAGAALRVIAYFDELTAAGAGLQAVVRGAAVLGAVPAALVDEDRKVRVRVDAQGRAGEPAGAPDPAWPVLRVGSGEAWIWLEHSGPARPADAMILERAAAAAAGVLGRTRGRATAAQHAESVEVLLDPAASPQARAAAAQRLRLPAAGQLRAVALADGSARVEPAATAADGPEPGAADDVRRGVGPAVPLAGLPSSWRAARLALRLTAEGTPQDPGPRVVDADRAGGLLALAAAVGPDTPPVGDVRAVESAATAAPWLLGTLEAISTAPSLRAAATTLRVHHSTLQERIAHAERLLGWSVGDPQGRLRLQLAVVLRRLHRAPTA